MRITLRTAGVAVALSFALAALAVPALAAGQAGAAPAIAGTPEVGQTLAVTGAPPGAVFRWQRCGELPYAPEILRDGPTAYYRLGDAEDAEVVADATGGEAFGAFANGVSREVEGGPFEDTEGAAGFDGLDDAIEVPDGPAVDLGDAFTLELWVRQAERAPGRLLDKGAGGYGLALAAGGTIVLDKVGAGLVAASTVPLPADGAFHHVVAVKEGSAARLYLDGVDVTGAVTARTIADTAAALRVAAPHAPAAGPPFRGELDELALYRKALPADSVRAHFDLGSASCVSIAGGRGADYAVAAADYGFALRALVGAGQGAPVATEQTAVVESRIPVGLEPPVVWGDAAVGQTLVAGEGVWAGLEPLTYAYQWQTCFDGLYRDTVLGDSPSGYWRLGELSGATAKDASGSGNKGTYVKGVSLGLDGALVRIGDANRAVRLDGRDDHVSVPDRSSLDLGNSLTIEAWVRRSVTGVRGQLVQKGIGGYALRIDADDRVHFAKSNAGDLAVSSAAVPADGAFHHVVATKHGATTRLYLDGRNVTQAVQNQALADTTAPLQIGRLFNQGTGGHGNYFPGDLDEVAVYGHALTAEDVRAHHEMGASGCVDIRTSGASAPSFRVTSRQVGARLRVVVTAQNEAGSAVAASAVTQAPADAGGDPIIASGTLSDAHGSPVAGAAVSLFLWPSAGEEDALVGSAADTALVAETTTNARGTYVLRSPLTPELQAEASANGGVVNLELRASAGGLLYQTFIERDFGAPDEGEQSLDGAEPMWHASEDIALAGPQRIAFSGDQEGVASVAGVTADPPTKGVECSDWDTMFNIWKKTGQGEEFVRVGELHTWSKMTNRFEYGTRSDSTIEIAFKGPLTKWFLNGKVHIGASSSRTAAAQVSASTKVGEYTSRAVRAKFVFTNWYQCGTGNKKSRAARWNGYSLGKGGWVSSRDGECSRLKAWIFEPNQMWQREKHKAVHWGFGANLGFIVVGARSGYSKWVKSRWIFGSTLTQRTLCGVKQYPDRAQRVFAGW